MVLSGLDLCPDGFEVGVWGDGGSVGAHDGGADVFVVFDEPFSGDDDVEVGFEEVPVDSGELVVGGCVEVDSAVVLLWRGGEDFVPVGDQV